MRSTRPANHALFVGARHCLTVLALTLLTPPTAHAAVPFVHETVDAAGKVGRLASLALDAQGNPRISYYDNTNGDLEYASAAIELADPAPGAVWPVGASRTIAWDGTGGGDLSLSTDGGRTWDPIAAGSSGGSYRDLVPHAPTRFDQYRLERAVPRSVGETGLFTVETSISLLSFAAQISPEGNGADLSWASDPGHWRPGRSPSGAAR